MLRWRENPRRQLETQVLEVRSGERSQLKCRLGNDEPMAVVGTTEVVRWHKKLV